MTRQYFWRVACKIQLARTNWNRKGQALSSFLWRPITMFRSHTWNIHVSKNNLAVSGSFLPAVVYHKKRPKCNARFILKSQVVQKQSIEIVLSSALMWVLGWCRVQQLDRKFWHITMHQWMLYTLFFYKNNFIRMRPKFAQKIKNNYM